MISNKEIDNMDNKEIEELYKSYFTSLYNKTVESIEILVKINQLSNRLDLDQNEIVEISELIDTFENIENK